VESSLFIAVKSPTPQHRKNLLWMLGDDPPIFAEEVPKKWQPMFDALEELAPDNVIPLTETAVLLTWLCGDWDEAFREYSGALSDAGFSSQSAYYWADEEEGYLCVNDREVSPVEPDKKVQASLRDIKELKKWSASDRRLVQRLVDLLAA
jgi:hypothetical protein